MSEDVDKIIFDYFNRMFYKENPFKRFFEDQSNGTTIYKIQEIDGLIEIKRIDNKDIYKTDGEL
jgi:hypothetical protein